jgi:hypothetical protein
MGVLGSSAMGTLKDTAGNPIAGGQCGVSVGCGGGGGQCGVSVGCSGGGGQCGVSVGCSGS